MARRRLPPGTKAKALELIKQGIDPLKIALDVGVSPGTIYKWAAESKIQSTAPSAAPSAVQSVGGSAPAPDAGISSPAPPIITEGAGLPLSDLLSKHPGTGFSAPEVKPPEPIPSQAPKPMEPAALIAVVMVTKTVIIQTVAKAWKVELTEEENKELSAFNSTELQALETLAPYAAEYTGTLAAYTKPLMAALFGGVFAFSTVTSIQAIKSKRKPKPKNVMKKEEK